MGNFEKLSVLVIVVIIVMILVVALYTWTDTSEDTQKELASGSTSAAIIPPTPSPEPAPLPEEWPDDIVSGDGESAESGTATDASEESAEPEPPLPDLEGPAVPEPAPAPADEPEEGPWQYTIKGGDTLSQIAEKELGTWRRQKEIMELNPGLDPLRIRAGDVIKMPPRGRPGARTESASVRSTPAPEHTPARGTIATGDWYVVRQGDRLSTIAKRAYGSIDRWPELWARNLSVVKDPDALEPGTRIYVPR